jgi:hypothetical protein
VYYRRCSVVTSPELFFVFFAEKNRMSSPPIPPEILQLHPHQHLQDQRNVRISYAPFRKIEVERKIKRLHWQSPLQPFSVSAPQKEAAPMQNQ